MTKDELDKIQKLYAIYEQPMYRIAFAVLKNSSYAEDAVSDAFTCIIKKIGRIDDPSSLRTKNYIVKIIKNASIDRYRKNKRYFEKALSIDEQTVLIPDNSINVEEDVLGSRYDRTDEMLNVLSGTDRQIVLLRCSDDLSWKEVASKLSLTESNVRKRFERARKKLISMKGETYGEQYRTSRQKKMG